MEIIAYLRVSSSFTNLHTGIMDYYSTYEAVYSLLWLQRKLHVIWWIASSDVTQWLSCIVGTVGARMKNVWNKQRQYLCFCFRHQFLKLSTMSPNSVVGVQCWTRLLFKTVAYVAHNATYPLSDITGGNSSDFTQLCATLFQICCSTPPRPVNTL